MFPEVLRQFALAGPPVEVEPYGSGHINHSYRVTCAEGTRYLLQRINTAIFTNPTMLMDNIERVTTHLAAQIEGKADAARRVLSLVSTKDGRTWTEADGGCWRTYRFVERARSYDTASAPEQAYQAAWAFGDFQRRLADLPAQELGETLPGFHDTPKRLAAFEAAVKADAAGRGAAVAAEIEFALSQRPLASVLVNAGLPSRVIHNDCKLNNVLFDEASGETLCVVDLDTVMPGLTLYDFGDMVRTAASPAAEDEQDLSLVQAQLPMFEGLVRGYLDAAGMFLTPDERALLPQAGMVITYEQALRFLADYLAGDTYYKVSRPGQNLDRARAQFALLRSLQQQERKLRRIARG